MKTLITSLLLLLTLISYAQKSAAPKDQTVTWIGRAAGGTYAPEGTLQIKSIDSKIENGIIEELIITIDMKSLYQENSRLTKHLKGKDFFQTKKYPEAQFNLTTRFMIETDSILIGSMTIKETTLEERITAKAHIEDNTILLSFNHAMNRLNYEVTFNSPTIFEKIKENAISDTIILKGNILIPLK